MSEETETIRGAIFLVFILLFFGMCLLAARPIK
jgi:hypothetical protein